MNSLEIFDGPNRLAMKIGEVVGIDDKNKKLKSISSSGMMFIDFKKQIVKNDEEKTELMALIKYIKFTPDCQSWLELENNTLKSPDKYDNNFNCSWLLSTKFGSYINLTFDHIYVNSNFLIILQCDLI